MINRELIVKHKVTLILLIVALVVLSGGLLIYRQLFVAPEVIVTEEVDLAFEAEGPYAILVPRTDGNAMIINLKRTSSYEAINYELTYNSEGIDRGVVGDIDTKERKGEYSQEILFGTCSRNVCKYDKNVENGTLTLRIKKGSTVYKMLTSWHLQKPDVALGKLTSGDNHLIYTLKSEKGSHPSSAKSSDLTLIGFTIINDLSGAPKLPSGKQILGKVYSLSVPPAKDLPAGEVMIELADSPPSGAKIAWFSEKDNSWVEMETKIEGSKLNTQAPTGGIFTVLAPQQ